MRFGNIIVAALFGAVPSAVTAAEPASSPSSERRLSPEQIEAVLAEAAKKRQAAEGHAVANSIERSASRKAHGEVGVSVGTGGYREVSGSAIAPMGENGAATIAVDFIDLGRRSQRR